ncbi:MULTISPECIES: DUF2092 domain-containing protein [unclassified Pseudomonas]|uniref:DUF2092 domain-containing protein n=1 Tax=unclassified Pseudomonas TaxID=196821 RepID=UPI0021C66CBE|nr:MULTISPECIES: DUF2092 domain-containing protein [unclassified Pseudomonas]MCU1730258.1 DUF2092 domain-containing protein [Pseudomonas sp. 20P_3.2_Bac4]MCU1744546.1 DUF2092 domain-containing protein [Pseudomonas sp. 20P_3.2_Bac5]
MRLPLLFTATTLALSLSLLPPNAHGADDPQRDPAAIAALVALGNYLQSIERFSLSARSETDQQLDSGQTIAFQHHTQVLAERPDKLYVNVDQNSASRQFFYDSKRFTLYDQRLNYFTRGDAPDSIDKLLDRLADRYGIELPLADLFRWNAGTADDVGISQAYVIDKENIEGQTCTHYAYRQPDIDWQLWLREGAAPLPCRLVITRRDDPERPRHSVSFAWDLTSPIKADAFTFIPPAKALAVPLVELRKGEQP